MTNEIQVYDLQEGQKIINTQTNDKLEVTKVSRGFVMFEVDGRNVPSMIIYYVLNGKSEWMQLPKSAFVTVEV